MAAAGEEIWFVAYGGGHMRMLIPVAQKLSAAGRAVRLIPLTVAVQPARVSGLPVSTLGDLIADWPEWPEILEIGRTLAPQGAAHPAMRDEDAHVYHGFGFRDLALALGRDAARKAYAERGRAGFHPIAGWTRILREHTPRAVITTTAPRSEAAVLDAAQALGLPSVCVTDHFLVYDDNRLARADQGAAITVLGQAVAEDLAARGRPPAQIHVTGNPAFDALAAPAARADAQHLRESLGWGAATVVLWPQEGGAHQVGGKPLVPPARIEAGLSAALERHPDMVLAIRPHPNNATPWSGAQSPRIRLLREPSVEALARMADRVVAEATTVALQAALCGRPVVTIANRGLPPFAEYGLATDLDGPEALAERLATAPPPDPGVLGAPPLGRAARSVADLVIAAADGAL
ncbi:MAG: hypothetical protein AAGE76_04055 [Pseudomonadota bacterium]